MNGSKLGFVAKILRDGSKTRQDDASRIHKWRLLRPSVAEGSYNSAINDDFTDRRMWDQASVRRQHMTAKGDEIASFVVPAERHASVPHVTEPRATFSPSRNA